MSLAYMLRRIMESGDGEERVFACHKFVAVGDGGNLFRSIMTARDSLFVTDDYRFGLLRRGEIRATVNLTDYRITPLTMAYLEPGSIVQVNHVSDDVEVTGIALSHDFFATALHGRFPEAFDGKESNYYIKVDGREAAPLCEMVDCVIDISRLHGGSPDAVGGLVSAVAHYFSSVVTARQRADGGAAAGMRRGGGRDIFERFMRLVHKAGGRERKLSYYADRLCLTERYLGTVVRQASGMTAKGWIDRAAVTAAKVMLLNTDLTVGQIADRLGFATDSFFCKYFKRMTGMTPTEERGRPPHAAEDAPAG